MLVHVGCSNEYPQSMFWSKNEKKVYPCKPQFYMYIRKVGCKGVFVTRTCFREVMKIITLLPIQTKYSRNMTTDKCVTTFYFSISEDCSGFSAGDPKSGWYHICRNKIETEPVPVYCYFTSDGAWTVRITCA